MRLGAEMKERHPAKTGSYQPILKQLKRIVLLLVPMSDLDVSKEQVLSDLPLLKLSF